VSIATHSIIYGKGGKHMDNIDKMVIDDMIKTVKEHLYQTSPIIGFS